MDSYIYEKIILYLPLNDILKCKQVCHLFNAIISEDLFWKHIYNRKFYKNGRYVNTSGLSYYDKCKKICQDTTLIDDIIENCQAESDSVSDRIMKLKNRRKHCYLRILFKNEITLSSNINSPSDEYDRFNFRVVKIPKSIKYFNEITNVNLSHNTITEIPDELCMLKNLVNLNIKYNKISTIPSSIKNLENLKKLDISHNEIEEIPEELYLMKSLEVLNIKFNMVRWISSSIKGLENLIKLNVSNNRIRGIPKELFMMQNLQNVDMSNNMIGMLPKMIKSTNKIENINLSHNLISAIPSELFLLEKLKNIDLKNNQINKIKNRITTVVNVECIDLQNNSFDDIMSVINKMKLRGKKKLIIILNKYQIEIFHDNNGSLRMSIS